MTTCQVLQGIRVASASQFRGLLAVAVLAALGLTVLVRLLRSRTAGVVVVVALTGFLLLELVIPLTRHAPSMTPERWRSTERSSTNPVARSPSSPSRIPSTELRGPAPRLPHVVFHARPPPAVNGYSGSWPEITRSGARCSTSSPRRRRSAPRTSSVCATSSCTTDRTVAIRSTTTQLSPTCWADSRPAPTRPTLGNAADRPWSPIAPAPATVVAVRRLLLGALFLVLVGVMMRVSWSALNHQVADLGDPLLSGGPGVGRDTLVQQSTAPLRRQHLRSHRRSVAYSDNLLVLLPPFGAARRRRRLGPATQSPQPRDADAVARGHVLTDAASSGAPTPRSSRPSRTPSAASPLPIRAISNCFSSGCSHSVSCSLSAGSKPGDGAMRCGSGSSTRRSSWARSTTQRSGRSASSVVLLSYIAPGTASSTAPSGRDCSSSPSSARPHYRSSFRTSRSG